MSVIADLIRAGVDPDLIQRVHDEAMDAVMRASELGLERLDVGLDTRSPAAIRQERYRRNKASQNVTNHNENVTRYAPPPPDKKNPPHPLKELTLTPLPPTSLRSVGPKPKTTKNRSQISEDEQPVEADLDFARKAGMESRRIGEEWAQFRDHHCKLGSLMADWRAAWRTWVRNCGKYTPRLAFSSGPDPPAKPRTPAERRESMLGWWQQNGMTRAQAEEKWERMPALHG